MLQEFRRFAVIALAVFIGLFGWSISLQPYERALRAQPLCGMTQMKPCWVRLFEEDDEASSFFWAPGSSDETTGRSSHLLRSESSMEDMREELIEIKRLLNNTCGSLDNPCFIDVHDDMSVYVTNSSLDVIPSADPMAIRCGSLLEPCYVTVKPQ